MNDWVVETPSFEEDLMNGRVIMLNQNGVNRVVEIIKEQNKELDKFRPFTRAYEMKKEIERLNNIINELEQWLEEQKHFIINTPSYTEKIKVEHKIMFKDYENVLIKIGELKGSDKE